ncbi:MAG: DUF1285 domain-containing protein [Pseudomonadota bacterium]
MSDLMRYAAALEGAEFDRGVPKALAKWDPPYCGELDMLIRADGVWIHEGTPIGRARLVRLFSTVLRREGDRYFLVTPVEKLGVQVEDAPFLAVLMRVEGAGDGCRLVFTTNVGDVVVAGADHPIEYRARPIAEADAAGEAEEQAAPYVRVRDGLDALVARPVFFDLVAEGERRHMDGVDMFGVTSDSVFFPFAPARDIDAP